MKQGAEKSSRFSAPFFVPGRRRYRVLQGKEKYEELQAEVICFESVDVITTSKGGKPTQTDIIN